MQVRSDLAKPEFGDEAGSETVNGKFQTLTRLAAVVFDRAA